MARKEQQDPKPGKVEQEVMAAIRKAGHAGITSQQLALQLGFKEKDKRYLVFDALEALQDKGQVKEGKKGRYTSTRNRNEAEGVIDIITSGAGYVRNETGGDDTYVHARDTGMALHGDRVRIKLGLGRGVRVEGKVVEVVERRRTEFVGTLHKHQGRLVMVCDDQKVQRPFFIPPHEANGGSEGDKVVAALGEWKDNRDLPRARVVRVLGRAGEHEVEIHAILAEFGLPLEFPTSVIDASQGIADGATAAEIARRRDMRTIPTITIDTDDAKDLDDALSLRRLDNGHWEVGVHIADVSHYVRPGTVIDMEAASRATSVYLVDRVVPMLPEKLSNDLCSLNPHTDKLSFSAIFELDAKARIKQEWFGRTVMRSQRRFAYAEAQAIIDGAGEGAFQQEVLTLHQLAQVLRADRMRNGALEIGGNEVKFKLDAKGRPVEVYEKVMGAANWLIEEFMLLANKRVATHVADLRKKTGVEHPFVYRVHDLPDPEKVQQLRTLVKAFGHSLDVRSEEELPHAINRLLAAIRGKEEENIIRQVAIRTMSKAVYSTDNIGHYGLAFTNYTHFTSPIRRYPDLLVHRGLQHYLDKGRPLDKGKLELSCEHSSNMEKRASDAERASIRYKQAEYLLERLGQRFEGTVSGVTNWGVYVVLNANRCEGMIALRDLPGDHYKFDQDRFMVVGQRTGKRIRLGDELDVVVRAVDMEKRTVDLALVENEGFTHSTGPSPSVTRPGQWDEVRPTAMGDKRPPPPRKGFRSPKGTNAKKNRGPAKGGKRKGR